MTKMTLRTAGGQTELFLLVRTTPFQHGERRLALLVLEEVNDLVHLRKILPIHARCKKIRDDKEYWSDVEAYFKKTTRRGFFPRHLPRLLPHTLS